MNPSGIDNIVVTQDGAFDDFEQVARQLDAERIARADPAGATRPKLGNEARRWDLIGGSGGATLSKTLWPERRAAQGECRFRLHQDR